MNPAPFLRAVVDASVAAKLFVPEALSAEAQTVFARFASENGAELIVPDLIIYRVRERVLGMGAAICPPGENRPGTSA